VVLDRGKRCAFLSAPCLLPWPPTLRISNGPARHRCPAAIAFAPVTVTAMLVGASLRHLAATMLAGINPRLVLSQQSADCSCHLCYLQFTTLPRGEVTSHVPVFGGARPCIAWVCRAPAVWPHCTLYRLGNPTKTRSYACVGLQSKSCLPCLQVALPRVGPLNGISPLLRGTLAILRSL